MNKRKLTRESLAELALRMPVLSEEVQSSFIGGGDGTYNNPYTYEEYLSLHNPTQVFYLNSGTLCYDLPDVVVVGQSGSASGSASGSVSGSVSGNVTNSNTGNGVYYPWGSLGGNYGDDGFQSWLYWGGGSNDSTNNGEGENGGNSALGWSVFGLNAAGDLGDNADGILIDRGKYMTPGKIYTLKYHPITVRFAIGGIETTSQVLNVIRVGGKWFGRLGNIGTLYNIYDEYTSGDEATAYWKMAFAAAEEGACVFIPGYGWAVSLGLGLVEQLIFD